MRLTKNICKYYFSFYHYARIQLLNLFSMPIGM